MRTLIVTNDFPPRTGGIESFVLAMAQRLPPGEVVVHTARQQGDRDFDRQQGFQVVRDRSPLMVPTPGITRRALEIARAEDCDRVWFGAAAPLGLMAPQLRKQAERLVATTHGHEIWWAAVPGTRRALRRIGKHTDVVTYLGEYTRSRIAPALDPADQARMRQLTPGVDDDVFRPDDAARAAIRAEHGLGDRPVVVCVSRMVARKGQDMLVRALPLIRKRVPGAALLIVGDGPNRKNVEKLADETGQTRDVVFAGRVPWARTPAYYAAGDVFCMPTRTRRGGLEPEALGICYLEAAATELPVVTGDSGGAPDAVLEGENGFVVDGRDPVAIAERCAELLEDKPLAKTFGKRGREWVAQQWRWDDLAVRLEDLLRGP